MQWLHCSLAALHWCQCDSTSHCRLLCNWMMSYKSISALQLSNLACGILMIRNHGGHMHELSMQYERLQLGSRVSHVKCCWHIECGICRLALYPHPGYILRSMAFFWPLSWGLLRPQEFINVLGICLSHAIVVIKHYIVLFICANNKAAHLLGTIHTS